MLRQTWELHHGMEFAGNQRQRRPWYVLPARSQSTKAVVIWPGWCRYNCAKPMSINVLTAALWSTLMGLGNLQCNMPWLHLLTTQGQMTKSWEMSCRWRCPKKAFHVMWCCGFKRGCPTDWPGWHLMELEAKLWPWSKASHRDRSCHHSFSFST